MNEVSVFPECRSYSNINIYIIYLQVMSGIYSHMVITGTRAASTSVAVAPQFPPLFAWQTGVFLLYLVRVSFLESFWL